MEKKSTTDELKEEREPLRLRAIQGDEFARKLMDMIDNELISRANDEFRKNNPDAEARHTEHGYTLPEDDD